MTKFVEIALVNYILGESCDSSFIETIDIGDNFSWTTITEDQFSNIQRYYYTLLKNRNQVILVRKPNEPKNYASVADLIDACSVLAERENNQRLLNQKKDEKRRKEQEERKKKKAIEKARKLLAEYDDSSNKE